MPATATTTLLGHLLLARLLSAKRTGPTAARASLNRLLPEPLSGAAWQALLDEMRSAGLVDPKSLRPTDAGRAQALEFLGVEQLPPRADWKTVVNRYLLPRALSEGERAPKKADEFRAYLLRAKYGLPATVGLSLKKAVEALACKQLGYPGETALAAVKRRKLGELLGTAEGLDADQLGRQLATQAAGGSTTKVDELRAALVRQWLAGEEGREAEPAAPRSADAEMESQGVELPELEFDLPAFAATVRAAARECPTGRFGANKVFINHLWRQLRYEPQFMSLKYADFKRRLVEANQQGLLHLSKADLPEAMDLSDVRESETPYLNAVFHFVLIEREQP
jgi:hypothetical protein